MSMRGYGSNVREPYRRCQRRAGAVLILVLTVTLVLTMAPPDDAAMSASGPSVGAFLSWLGSGLTTSVSFAQPRKPPIGPRQVSGTAAGRGHRAPSASTRAGRGTGHKPGKGTGELPSVAPLARTAGGEAA
jgi:large repetitive protein